MRLSPARKERLRPRTILAVELEKIVDHRTSFLASVWSRTLLMYQTGAPRLPSSYLKGQLACSYDVLESVVRLIVSSAPRLKDLLMLVRLPRLTPQISALYIAGLSTIRASFSPPQAVAASGDLKTNTLAFQDLSSSFARSNGIGESGESRTAAISRASHK